MSRPILFVSKNSWLGWVSEFQPVLPCLIYIYNKNTPKISKITKTH